MTGSWFYTLGAVLFISLISLIGVVVVAVSARRLSKIILFFVSFAAGGLLGDSFFHLLPEASRLKGFDGWVSFWVLSGIILFFVLEKFISWRHCHLPTSSDHPHPLGFMILIFGQNLEIIRPLVPFTAGGFIYIASSDLIPELKKEVGLGKSAFQLLGVILGITVMVLLGLRE